jgi:hypothetical protein
MLTPRGPGEANYRGPVPTPDLSTRAIAVLYWEHYAASTSPDREQRLRAERGDLSDHAAIFENALRDDTRCDDTLAAIIDVLVSERPVAVADGLAFLAAGPIEDLWNSGDTEVLSRLRARGVSPEVIREIEGGVWKHD